MSTPATQAKRQLTKLASERKIHNWRIDDTQVAPAGMLVFIVETMTGEVLEFSTHQVSAFYIGVRVGSSL